MIPFVDSARCKFEARIDLPFGRCRTASLSEQNDHLYTDCFPKTKAGFQRFNTLSTLSKRGEANIAV